LSYQMYKNVIVCEAERFYNYLFNFFKGIVSPEGIGEIHNLIA